MCSSYTRKYIIQYTLHQNYKNASQRIIRLCIPAFIFHRDPETGSSGSSQPRLALSGEETQHVPCFQLHFRQYVVFRAGSVTGRAGAEKPALLIPCAWYTSGKLAYTEKSDRG